MINPKWYKATIEVETRNPEVVAILQEFSKDRQVVAVTVMSNSRGVSAVGEVTSVVEREKRNG